jgi:Arc/MetJ family transcription regulator
MFSRWKQAQPSIPQPRKGRRRLRNARVVLVLLSGREQFDSYEVQVSRGLFKVWTAEVSSSAVKAANREERVPRHGMKKYIGCTETRTKSCIDAKILASTLRAYYVTWNRLPYNSLLKLIVAALLVDVTEVLVNDLVVALVAHNRRGICHERRYNPFVQSMARPPRTLY